MISYATALQHIQQACQPLPSEQVPLAQAIGRVLAQDVQADADLPPFDNSAMDGFALAGSGAVLAPGREFAVAGSQAAGDGLAVQRGDILALIEAAIHAHWQSARQPHFQFGSRLKTLPKKLTADTQLTLRSSANHPGNWMRSSRARWRNWSARG